MYILFLDETMNYTVIERTYNEAFQALWIELQFAKQRKITCDAIYKQDNSAERFLHYFEEAVDRYCATINTLPAQTCNFFPTVFFSKM